MIIYFSGNSPPLNPENVLDEPTVMMSFHPMSKTSKPNKRLRAVLKARRRAKPCQWCGRRHGGGPEFCTT